MKLMASILICSMMILGLNGFAERMSLQDALAETNMSCGMDCCDQDQGCCGHEDSEDQDEQDNQDQQCPRDCGCSFDFHLVAIEYHFVTSFGVAPKAAEYGHYANTYHFEYFNLLFQPPRFS